MNVIPTKLEISSDLLREFNPGRYSAAASEMELPPDTKTWPDFILVRYFGGGVTTFVKPTKFTSAFVIYTAGSLELYVFKTLWRGANEHGQA